VSFQEQEPCLNFFWLTFARHLWPSSCAPGKKYREREKFTPRWHKNTRFSGYLAGTRFATSPGARPTYQKHGRSVSWGSWVGNADRGITIYGGAPVNFPVLPGEPMASFGSRLRYERERRQIALKSIAESTKIGITLLEGLERDDVSRWPSGIFRKCFVRSYAEAIGLDPEPTVREFVELYPDPLDTDSVSPPSIAVRPLIGNCTAPDASPRRSSTGPLAVKLTITWSGSLHHTVARLVDWKIGRSGAWNVFRRLRSFNLSMLHSSKTAQEQVPPA
jgi:transcriptional regulator with XRE-family HTH domain